MAIENTPYYVTFIICVVLLIFYLFIRLSLYVLNLESEHRNTLSILVLTLGMSISFTIGFQYGIRTDYQEYQKNEIHREYTENLDEYFRITYSNISESEGNIIIDNIVSSASVKYSNDEKLDTIAELITDNFTNPYWNDTHNYFWNNDLGGNLLYNHKYFGNIYAGYGYDKRGRLRALNGTSFYNKPYWIAYMKTGACQELAVLFNETASRAGFENRIVWAPDNHVWNEVKIDGDWLYADVTCYPTNKSQYWIGNRTKYTVECATFVKGSKIYIFPSVNEEDDITIAYY